FDFESGSLVDWQAEGEAFAGQPIEGDTVFARRKDMHSRHRGRFWIGTFERNADPPQGTLTSVPFKVTYPYASFLVAGGSHPETCVEIVRQDSQKSIYQVSGDNSEDLKPAAVDLREHLGKEIFIRLVDRHSGGWGHINFDDFRFHDTKPDYPVRAGAQPPDAFAHAGLSPEEAAKAMTVPEGFKVTLFAGEPDVVQPIAQAIDDRGRLWVAEAYSYPHRLPPEQAHDRILIFEDTNGDNHFDRRTVFIENLNLVSGLEVGFGGVWVGMAPYFLFIPDRDGDDVPDGEPQVLLDGWGLYDTHETLNSFIWGPDGWLYGCHGVFTHSRVGKPETPDEERTPINAGIWRYHPTKHEFEVFAHGTSNPWGIDFNDQGQAFLTACVIPHLFHVIQGGRYQRQAGQHFNPYTYGDIQTIALHRHWIGDNPHRGNNRSDAAGGGHAHAGAMIYLGGSWPAEYRNQLFMNNIHGARLNQDLLTPKGSGYVGD
ncbi:MAG: PVC-type heme-binding CxxCH protein, partial [Pirellulales bacterium]